LHVGLERGEFFDLEAIERRGHALFEALELQIENETANAHEQEREDEHQRVHAELRLGLRIR
jgi:hypothetical protein